MISRAYDTCMSRRAVLVRSGGCGRPLHVACASSAEPTLALQRDEIFFISDLSYSDLVVLTRIQQWTDAEGTVSLEGEEPCGEATCERITLVPAQDNGEFPCRRYRLWFTRDDRLLRKAELYDPEHR